MTKKCTGCGIELQDIDSKLEGYVENINSNLCTRCFRIKNYGDYKFVTKDNNDFITILKDINKTNDLVILVVDVFNINDELLKLSSILNNKILLVLSKRDLLPKSIYEDRILNYLDRYNLNIIDKVFVSSVKNYQFDLLYDKINKYKSSDTVYVVGFTNAGKSTLINKLIYNYSDEESDITTSVLPSTTLNNIEVKLNDNLTLIDTPGLLDSGNIINYVSAKELKKIIPSKTIKPKVYQVKGKQTICLDKYAYIECLSDTNLTLYISNAINVERYYKDMKIDMVCHKLKVGRGNDIVITGLGFIKVSKDTIINLYTLNGVKAYIRDSLI